MSTAAAEKIKETVRDNLASRPKAWRVKKVKIDHAVSLPWRLGIQNGLAELVPLKGETFTCAEMLVIEKDGRRVSIPYHHVLQVHQEYVEE